MKIRVFNPIKMRTDFVKQLKVDFCKYIHSKFRDGDIVARMELLEEYEVTVNFVCYIRIGNCFYTMEGGYDKIWRDIDIWKVKETGEQTVMF